MNYLVIIYYVVVTGDRFSESLSVNKSIHAVSADEAIGKACRLFIDEHGDNYFIARIDVMKNEIIDND